MYSVPCMQKQKMHTFKEKKKRRKYRFQVRCMCVNKVKVSVLSPPDRVRNKQGKTASVAAGELCPVKTQRCMAQER